MVQAEQITSILQVPHKNPTNGNCYIEISIAMENDANWYFMPRTLIMMVWVIWPLRIVIKIDNGSYLKKMSNLLQSQNNLYGTFQFYLYADFHRTSVTC